MILPEWIWFAFIFAFGCCVGSFLNVVIYRLPLDMSLVRPGSACPACGRGIRFYDNIPLISWLLLGRKCRYCKAPISVRYFVVELLTGAVFGILFFVYFRTDLRAGVDSFINGGWLIYVATVVLAAGLIAASAIDLQLWVIPIAICWVVTAMGIIASSVSGYVMEPGLIRAYSLFPTATAATGLAALGAVIGLGISWALLAKGWIKRSYDSDTDDNQSPSGQQVQINHRGEVLKEVVFLLPIIVCAAGAYFLGRVLAVSSPSLYNGWVSFSARPAVCGFLGSIWGWFIAGGTVWATRILGTLGFGKEAMGLGDVHLMAAAGAVTGPVPAVAAFFIAPFFGLVWGGYSMIFKKSRQIPYGPFLSLAVFLVIILHDHVLAYRDFILCR